jgi:hypothetical protein
VPKELLFIHLARRERDSLNWSWSNSCRNIRTPQNDRNMEKRWKMAEWKAHKLETKESIWGEMDDQK